MIPLIKVAARCAAAMTLLLLLTQFSGITQAQNETCSTVVLDALASVDEGCADTGRNQVCYGNNSLQVTAREGVDAFTFEEAGDLLDVAAIDTLTLRQFNEDTGEWGIALMKLQANLPDRLPGQNLTFILFGDVEITNAVDPDAPSGSDDALTPMQAFYFSSGVTGVACDDVPQDGILIQTPEGAGAVSFRANDVEVTLGSSAFFQAQAGNVMRVSVIEGQGEVTADGKTVIIPEGAQVVIPIDNELSANGEPGDPVPYDDAPLETLPVSLLPETVTVAPPADPDDLVQDSGDDNGGSGGGMTGIPGMMGGFDPSGMMGMDAATLCPIMTQALEGSGITLADYLAQMESIMGMIPEADRAYFQEFLEIMRQC